MKKIITALTLAAAVLAGTPAYAMSYYLVNQWLGSSGTMCEYSNGTILNVGARMCPLRIEG